MQHLSSTQRHYNSSVVKGYLGGFCAVLFWSLNVIISRYLANEVPPILINLMRWVIAGVLLFPFTFNEIRHNLAAVRQSWLLILVLGLLGVTTFNTLIYMAGASISAIDMALILSIGPVFIALFSWIFLHKPITLRQGIGLCIALAGVFVLLLRGSIANITEFTFAIGDIYTICASASFALYSTLLSFKRSTLSSLAFLELTILAGIAFMIPFSIEPLQSYSFTTLHTYGIVSIIYMGIFQSIFAFLWWTHTLQSLGTIRAGILFYTMPVFSSIAAYFFLNEVLQQSQLLGGAMVLAGVIYAAIGNRDDVEAEPRP
ncbi:MAG: DMT family transporter [Pseudomonadota bacterium]